MKNIILTVTIILASIFSLKAQKLSINGNIDFNIPQSDLSDIAGFGYGIRAGAEYLVFSTDISENLKLNLSGGLEAAFSLFGKEELTLGLPGFFEQNITLKSKAISANGYLKAGLRINKLEPYLSVGTGFLTGFVKMESDAAYFTDPFSGEQILVSPEMSETDSGTEFLFQPGAGVNYYLTEKVKVTLGASNSFANGFNFLSVRTGLSFTL